MTHFTLSAVLKGASNVLTAYARWKNHSSSFQSYYSESDATADAYREWQITWDSSDNTWTIDVEDDLWEGANNVNVGMRTTGGKVTKYTDQYDIVVTGSGAGYGPSDDDRIWEIEVG